MLSPKLRLFLAALFLATGIIGFFVPTISTAVCLVLLLTAALLFLGHFRNGPMLRVLINLRKGELHKAEALLDTVKRPEWLNKRYQGYYHFAKALLASHAQDVDAAETHSTQALALSNYLHTEELGILRYNLARVAYERQEWGKAKVQLEQLKQLQLEDLHLKKRIEELETELAKR